MRVVAVALLAGLVCACGSAPEDRALAEERIAQRTAEIVLARLEAERAEREEPAARGGAGAQQGEGADFSAILGDEARTRIPTDGAPGRGAREPLVTIVVFSDFQCPFCERVRPTIDRILRERPDEVRFVFRNHPLPFHQDAHLAAQAAHEAFVQRGDVGFWRAHDLFFDHQRALDRTSLEGYARTLGLDLARFNAALDAQTHAPKIDADTALSVRVGATGTPTFFLNGRELAGAQPYEAFDLIVEQEVASAEELIAAGVRRSDVYEVIMDYATGAPEPAPSAPAAAAPAHREPDPSAVYSVPVGDSYAEGPADALVTLIVSTDFECPFCARLQPTLAQLRTRYRDDLRLVFKHNPLPFHTHALEAAEAALEARAQRGDAAYRRMHDLLFQNQRALERADLESYAANVGLDLARFRSALDRDVHVPAIEAEQNLLRSRGATATPSSFVNGRNLRGAQPIEAFAALVDEELARARARVRAGTPQSQLYAEIARTGATSPQFTTAPPAAAPAAPAIERYMIIVPSDAPVRGPQRAQLTIQIFTDFQCPFCSRALPTIDRLLDAYPNNVRLVFRHYPLPFHEHAMLAHEAAWEVKVQAGDAAFWRYYRRLFENQRTLERPHLERFARELGGIDMRRFRRALDQNTHRPRIEADIEAVRRAGARIGTPSFLIGDRLIQGAQPYEIFRDAVEDELSP